MAPGTGSQQALQRLPWVLGSPAPGKPAARRWEHSAAWSSPHRAELRAWTNSQHCRKPREWVTSEVGPWAPSSLHVSAAAWEIQVRMAQRPEILTQRIWEHNRLLCRVTKFDVICYTASDNGYLLPHTFQRRTGRRSLRESGRQIKADRKMDRALPSPQEAGGETDLDPATWHSPMSG